MKMICSKVFKSLEKLCKRIVMKVRMKEVNWFMENSDIYRVYDTSWKIKW
jgi:hypothetical protein